MCQISDKYTSKVVFLYYALLKTEILIQVSCDNFPYITGGSYGYLHGLHKCFFEEGAFLLLLRGDMIGIHCNVTRSVRRFGIIISGEGKWNSELNKWNF